MILYNSNEKEFINQGICTLNAVINWTVTSETNGVYELELEYPIDDKYFKEIKFRRIVYCKPSPTASPQPFRIYAISTPINRTIIVNASHISYDLSGYPVEPFEANSAEDAINKLKSNTVQYCPFNFTTNIVSTDKIKIDIPRSIRSVMGSDILDTYKPEYYFDKFDVYCKDFIGINRGVEIRYGKNMIDMNQEENISDVYTSVYPFWKSDKDGMITLPEKTIATPGNYDYTKILIYDVSSVFQDIPTVSQIRQETLRYIEESKLGIPKVSLTLSFVQLSELDRVDLGDTVTVIFDSAKVSTTARCIKTVYNGKKNRYDSIEIGEATKTLATEIVDSNQNIYRTISATASDVTNKSYFDQTIETMIKDITGTSGGYIRLSPPRNPNELLIMNTKDLNTATIIWKWTNTGLSVSRNGYTGTFFPVTTNGKFNINDDTCNKIKNTMIDATIY